MGQVTLKGNPVATNGELPAIGSTLQNYQLVNSGLSEIGLEDYKGKRVILNIFPSIDTSTCATSVRTFNSKAAALENTVVLCISKDLPFAQKRFCGAEGIENVEALSDFRTPGFAEDLGIVMQNGALKGLDARAIVVLDETGVVVHTELVPEIVDEPNYEAALTV